MIFPSERISELERDVHVKRQSFYTSQNRFMDRVHAQLTPKNIFKGGLLGALVGLPALFFAGKFMMGGGFFSKIMKAGVLFGIKTATPLVKPLFQSLVKKVLKKF